MTNEDNVTNVPISNWTLATGTKPGAREVYAPPPRSTAPHIAPANLVIRTNAEPDAENRSMEFIGESAAFYRSSRITLEGDRAPNTTMVEFRSLPPGDYEVTAMLIGADGHRRATAHAQVNVVELGLAR
jgi:hypothetical protein